MNDNFEAPMHRVDSSASTIHFTLPFAYARGTFTTRCRGVQNADWLARVGNRVPMWTAVEPPRDEMVPHVADLVSPSQPEADAIARIWRVADGPFHSRRGAAGQDPWVVEVGRSEPLRVPVSFRIKSIHLVLFHLGTGFLIVECVAQSSSIDDRLNMVHHVRFAGRSRTKPERYEGDQEPPDLPHVLSRLLDTARVDGDGESPWWFPVAVPGVLMAFVILYLDGAKPDDVARFFYLARNFFHPEQSPHGHDEPDDDVYQRERGLWHFVTDEGAGFFAADAPATQFYRNDLPNRLARRYLLAWLFALNQRFVLEQLSSEVLEWSRVARGVERVDRFRDLRRTLLDFGVRDRNLRVYHRPRQHRFYQACCAAFELGSVYDEVRQQINDVYSDLLLEQQSETAQRTTHLERRLGLLAAVFGIPAIVLGFLGINLRGVTSEFGLDVATAASLFAVGWVFGAVLLWITLRPRREGATKRRRRSFDGFRG